MKEFNAQTGGRYTYVDDIVNLQELALAFASIFDECDNFIISGCKISGSTISSGYVYINGKIRYFSGVSNVTSWPQYLYETNKTETVAYASGDDKVGRKVYGCAISSEAPTSIDALTGEVPMFIELTQAGGMGLRDAFFGKYSLTLHSASETQTVSDVVTFDKDINVNGVLTANGAISLIKGNAKGKVFYSSNRLVVQSQVAGKTMAIAIDTNEGFKFSVNNDIFLSIDLNGAVNQHSVIAGTSAIGNIRIAQNDIFNKGVASDDACVNINVKGYNNGTAYYRNTIIGDGRGSVIIKVTGSTKNVHIKGDISIDSTATASLSLRKDKLIQWLDDSSGRIAYVGYNNSSAFEIQNTATSIVISAVNFVDISPAIKEGGTLLKDKYVLKNNNTFATKTGGFTQFISGDSRYTVDNLRDQIQAEKKISDTGWVKIIDGLYARQIGSVVCIQGTVKITGNGDAFILPDAIMPPKYTVVYHAVSSSDTNARLFASCTIPSNTRTCKVSGNTQTVASNIYFSMTYMV